MRPALATVRVDDSLVDLLGLWDVPMAPHGDGWEVAREQVDGTVELAFSLYDVAGFYSDARERALIPTPRGCGERRFRLHRTELEQFHDLGLEFVEAVAAEEVAFSKELDGRLAVEQRAPAHVLQLPLGGLVLDLFGEEVLVLQPEPVLSRQTEGGTDLGRRLPCDLLLAGHDLGHELGRPVEDGGEVGLRPAPGIQLLAKEFTDRNLARW
jgi:hypothetical protein